jgi:hypothetical protein
MPMHIYSQSDFVYLYHAWPMDVKIVITLCLRVPSQFQTLICSPAVKQGQSWKKFKSIYFDLWSIDLFNLIYLFWAQCQKAIGSIYFTKKWGAETLQPGLEFDNFKPWIEGRILTSPDWTVVFGE